MEGIHTEETGQQPMVALSAGGEQALWDILRMKAWYLTAPVYQPLVKFMNALEPGPGILAFRTINEAIRLYQECLLALADAEKPFRVAGMEARQAQDAAAKAQRLAEEEQVLEAARLSGDFTPPPGASSRLRHALAKATRNPRINVAAVEQEARQRKQTAKSPPRTGLVKYLKLHPEPH